MVDNLNDKLWTSSQTTTGWDVRRAVGRLGMGSVRHFHTKSCGARGGCTPRAGHRESAGGAKTLPIRGRNTWLRWRRMNHVKSWLPHLGRTFEVSVEGREGVRLEPATLLGYNNDGLRTSWYAVMRARKVSLWLRHDAPMTSVASQGGSASLHHGICRVESQTWCELKFTLSGPHVCAIASGCGIFGCCTFFVDRDCVPPSVLAISIGEGANEV